MFSQQELELMIALCDNFIVNTMPKYEIETDAKKRGRMHKQIINCKNKIQQCFEELRCYGIVIIPLHFTKNQYPGYQSSCTLI